MGSDLCYSNSYCRSIQDRILYSTNCRVVRCLTSNKVEDFLVQWNPISRIIFYFPFLLAFFSVKMVRFQTNNWFWTVHIFIFARREKDSMFIKEFVKIIIKNLKRGIVMLPEKLTDPRFLSVCLCVILSSAFLLKHISRRLYFAGILFYSNNLLIAGLFFPSSEFLKV